MLSVCLSIYKLSSNIKSIFKNKSVEIVSLQFWHIQK